MRSPKEYNVQHVLDTVSVACMGPAPREKSVSLFEDKCSEVNHGLKILKTPFMVNAASLIPFCCILCLSLFLAWQWFVQAPFSLDFPAALDVPVSLPLDRTSDDLVRSSEPLISVQVTLTRDQVSRSDENCCRCEVEDDKVSNNSHIHNLSDEELFARAISLELDRGGDSPAPATKPSLCAGSDLSTEQSIKNGQPLDPRFGCTPCLEGATVLKTSKVKVAFLFLITTALPFEALWNKYFEDKEDFYNIYVHADPSAGSIVNRSSVFWGRLIPSEKAIRGHPTLVKASNRLLASALLDDPSNQYFALLSDHCIPIRGFDYAYRRLTSSKQSFLEIVRNATVMWERYSSREGGQQMMLPEIPFEKFRKGSQWYVLIRRHALVILRDKIYWNKFTSPCKIHFCGTDEHYYPTLIYNVDPNGTTGYTVTNVKWPPWVSEHPLTYQWYDIKEELISELQKQDGGRYLFARKFHDSTPHLLTPFTYILLQR